MKELGHQGIEGTQAQASSNSSQSSHSPITCQRVTCSVGPLVSPVVPLVDVVGALVGTGTPPCGDGTSINGGVGVGVAVGVGVSVGIWLGVGVAVGVIGDGVGVSVGSGVLVGDGVREAGCTVTGVLVAAGTCVAAGAAPNGEHAASNTSGTSIETSKRRGDTRVPLTIPAQKCTRFRAYDSIKQ